MNKKTRYKYVVSPGALSEASFFTSCESRWLVEIEECPSREDEVQEQRKAEKTSRSPSMMSRGIDRFAKVFQTVIQYLPASETGYVA